MKVSVHQGARKRTFLLAESLSMTMAQVSREALINRVTEIAERVGGPEGIDVVEVEFAGAGRARVLRIFIDKPPQGVTHGDCEFISNHVGTILDVEDVVPGDGYHLEVSSPGVERKLRKPADFQRFAGQKAKMVLTEPVEGQKHWEGTLRGLENDSVVLIEASENRLVRVPIGSIRRANLKFEW
jgi:ribosome maturation factor RimP